MGRILRAKPFYILVGAVAFFLFQLFLLLNSFSAVNRIYTAAFASGDFWRLFWFVSEFTGEIGLLLRFVAACLSVAFAWLLWKRKEFSFPVLRKAVLLEGAHYLFYIPFIVNLFTRPADTATTLTVYRETALSYAIQTVLVSSSFIMLYKKMRKPNTERKQLAKWGAIAAVCYLFALWTKHFMFNLYALPIDLTNPVLFAGLLNSALTMLAAAFALLVSFMPVIKGKAADFNQKAAGFGFVMVGAYFVVYILVAQVNSTYMAFLQLTELWAITFAVVGAGLLAERNGAIDLQELLQEKG